MDIDQLFQGESQTVFTVLSSPVSQPTITGSPHTPTRDPVATTMAVSVTHPTPSLPSTDILSTKGT